MFEATVIRKSLQDGRISDRLDDDIGRVREFTPAETTDAAHALFAQALKQFAEKCVRQFSVPRVHDRLRVALSSEHVSAATERQSSRRITSMIRSLTTFSFHPRQ